MPSWSEHVTDALALDIALLLPKSTAQQIVGWNQRLPDRRLALDTRSVLPHISLWMGCVPEAVLAELQARLTAVLLHHSALSVEVRGLAFGKYNDKTTVTSLEVACSLQFMQLHEDICVALQDLDTRPSQPKHFADFADVDQVTVDYVDGYTSQHVRQQFWPHITLGFGRFEGVVEPLRFVADTVAICHLGPYCTCRDKRHVLVLEPRQ